jgi:hypothetical protein
MIERTTVRLPGDLLKKARRKAADENTTLTALMEDGLRYVVEELPKKKLRKRRVRLPVSSATGGFYPGIDISNNAAIQELEDEEYIERLNRGFR